MIAIDLLSDEVKDALANATEIYDGRDVAKEFKKLKQPLGELSSYIEDKFIQIGVTDKGVAVYIRK